MKKVLIMSSLVFASALHSIAAEAGIGTTKKTNASEKVTSKTENTKAEAAVTKKSLTASVRANHLTDQMIRDLRLNNYQARKLRSINLEKINRMMAIEAKGGDPTQVDFNCKGVCKERDTELENILSTEQYSMYFSNRPTYYKLDKQYAMGGYLNQATAQVNKDNLDNNDDDATASDNTQVASR